MNNMIQVIIDIPEEKYTAIKNNLGTFPREYKEWGLQAIADGTPLDDIKTLKHRLYLEGFHEAYQMYYKMFDDIKAEIRQKQWHLGVDSSNQVIEIIDKHIGGQNEQS